MLANNRLSRRGGLLILALITMGLADSNAFGRNGETVCASATVSKLSPTGHGSPAWSGQPKSAIASHPFHVSYAEVEWNPRSMCLEIALHVWPNDLEEALEERFERDLVLEETDDIDALITTYLDERIQFTEPDESSGSLTWVGKEVAINSCWLYFEVELTGGPDQLNIEHRLFFEKFDEQTNLFHYRRDNHRLSLRFNTDNPRQTLNLADLKIGIR